MISIVTLLGEWPLTHPWVRPCIESWVNIKGITTKLNVISDGTLGSVEALRETLGSCVEYSTEQDFYVEEVLKQYPSLAKIRSLDLTWRKILDTVILFQNHSRVLLIDTDVLIRRPIALPEESGVFYLREDIPAYQGSPLVPWNFPMVRSFNAGFVLFEPSLIDLNFLEQVVSYYFINLKNFWWTEQLAWSLCAGRIEKRFFWKGRCAAVLSGFKTRNSNEISSDVVKAFSSNKRLKSGELLEISKDASVLHLAGLGKHHWKEFPVCFDGEVIPLEYELDPLITLLWKTMISLRLLGKKLS